MKSYFFLSMLLIILNLFCSCNNGNAQIPLEGNQANKLVIRTEQAVPEQIRVEPLDYYRESTKQQYFLAFDEGTSLYSIVDQKLMPINENLSKLKSAVITKDGTMILSKDNKYFLTDENGTPLSDIKVDYIAEINSEKNTSFVFILDGKYGLLDKMGNELFPARYSYIGGYGDGLFLYIENNKYGYMDTNGNEVIPAIFDVPNGIVPVYSKSKDDVYFLFEGLLEFAVNRKFVYGCAKYEKDGCWGAISKEGSTIIEPYWSEIEILNGFIKVCQNTNTEANCILMNAEGKYLTKIANSNDAERAMVIDNGWISIPLSLGYEYINDKGIQFESPYTILSPKFVDNIAIIESNDGGQGYINSLGKVIVEPVWKKVSEFSEGLGGVIDADGFINYIDKNGNLIFPIRRFYTPDNSIEKCSENLIAVCDPNGKYGYVNDKGKFSIGAQWNNAFEFQNGRAIVSSESGYGLINQKGDKIISPIWSMVFDLYDKQGKSGEYYLVLNNFGATRPSFGCFNRDGEEVIKAQFDQIRYIGHDIFICDRYERVGPEFTKVYNTVIIS